MGSNMRTREAIALGENENRRLDDIIEAGNTAGWHSFEQSLTKAFEQNLITEETALLYCVNRNQMRQRIDAIKKLQDEGTKHVTLKMKAAQRSFGSLPPPMPWLAAPAETVSAGVANSPK